MATSKLQSLTTLWQEFDLPGTQKLLDELAGQITDRQDESDASKKTLIELTRAFKKSNSEETRLVVSPLLKSFQNEVDNLTKRSKAAEKSFFDIYQKFCDIADPVPTLEYCMESVKGLHKLQDLEIEVNQLRETLTLTNNEVTRLKFKEKELTQAQEKLGEMEKNMEVATEDKVQQHRERIQQEFDQKLKVVEEEQIMSAHKLAEAETKYKTAQNLLQDAQVELDELKYKEDGKRSAISDDMEILLTDLERANQRAITAEREVTSLTERLQEISNLQDQTEKESVDSVDEKSLQIQLSAKEREVSQLVEDLHKANKSCQETEAKYSAKMLELQQRSASLEQEKSELEGRLDKQQDYQQVKKDLAILRTLEFSSHQEASTDTVDGLEDSRPLEVLILERSKVLQSENSMMRLDKERMAREIQNLRSDYEASSSQCSKQADLILQLEQHVEQLQTISTPFREEAEGRASSDMLAEVLRESPDDVFHKEASLSPVPTSAECSGTMLSIVQAQRERIRARNDELELLNEQQTGQINLLQGEIKHLKQDNLKLYEKIRFLQSCTGGKSNKEVVVPVETKYKSSYEQRLDPFTSFNQSERQRKYGQLSVFEKIILSLVRFITSNKTARLAVFFYAVLMHGLVFAVLYKLALTESCKHDMAARWHDKFINHMQEVHGNGPDQEIG